MHTKWLIRILAKAVLVVVQSGNKTRLVPSVQGDAASVSFSVSPCYSNFSAAEQVTYMNGQNGLTSPDFQLSVDYSKLLVVNAEAKNYSCK